MLLKSNGVVYVLKRGSFRAEDGSVVQSLTVYDPDSCQTIQFFGDACALVPESITPMENIDVTVEWRFSKARGWKPRLLAVSL